MTYCLRVYFAFKWYYTDIGQANIEEVGNPPTRRLKRYAELDHDLYVKFGYLG